MNEAAADFGTEYLEIDHPWVSHRHMPIYEFTFPRETLDAKVADCGARSRVRTG